MDSRNIILKETIPVLIGQAVCIPLIALVFRALGYYDVTVLPGAIAGAVIATANFFFMALTTSLAADKAQQQDVKGGQATIQTSYILRQVLLFAALVLCAKTEQMNLIALVIPLVLVRPIITVAELFRKKGGSQV